MAKKPKASAPKTETLGTNTMTEETQTPAAPIEPVENATADTTATGAAPETTESSGSGETEQLDTSAAGSSDDSASSGDLTEEEKTDGSEEEQSSPTEETVVGVKATDPAVVFSVPPTAPVVETEVPFVVKAQQGKLEEYQRIMGGKHITSQKEQIDAQMIFRGVINDLIKSRGQNFVLLLDNLLAFIRANSDYAFRLKYVFRHFDKLSIDPAQRNVLVNIITLLMNIADPATRSMAIRQVDLNSALKGLPDHDSIRELFHEYITR